MESKNFPQCFYRVSIKGLYIREGKLLLVKESPQLGGQWGLPGGGLNFGEVPQVGLKREIKEEMGIEVTNVASKPIYAWTTKFNHKRGMDWYYSLVLCYKVEIEDLNFTPSEECEEIAFYSKDELDNLDLQDQAVKIRKVFNLSDFA